MSVIAGSDGVAAVDRAFAVVSAIASRPDPSTLADIASETGLYKSTILRLIRSLETAGFVLRMRDGRYGLGASAFRLGLAYELQNPLRRNVLPVLEELVEQGTESSSFHVRHGPATRMCVFRVNSHHSTLDRIEPGIVLPVDRGAPGRVLLAFSGRTGKPYDEIRSNGYAVSRGERDPLCSAVAAPVLGPTGQLLGCISLSGPSERFTPALTAKMRRLVLAASRQLTASFAGGLARKTG